MSSRIERSLLAIASSISFVVSAMPGTAAAECSVARPRPQYIEERPASQLDDPGWVDVGAGVVVARHAGASGQTGVGNMVSLRAYPWGRWYAPLKTAAPAATATLATAVQVQQQAQSDAETKQKIAETKVADAKAKQADANQKKDAASGTAAKQATDDAQAAQDAADKAKQKADLAAQDIYAQMQSAANQFSSIYAVCERNGINNVLNRVSVFYGRSVGGFDNKVVEGDINVFGLAVDIAPQFSIVWGKAYYKQVAENGGPAASKSSNVFGVQLNLNAFKIFRGLSGSL